METSLMVYDYPTEPEYDDYEEIDYEEEANQYANDWYDMYMDGYFDERGE